MKAAAGWHPFLDLNRPHQPPRKQRLVNNVYACMCRDFWDRDKVVSDESTKDPEASKYKSQKSKDRRPAATKRAEYLARYGHGSNSTDIWGRAPSKKQTFTRAGRSRLANEAKLVQPVMMVHKSTKTSETWDRKLEWGDF